MNHAVIAGGIRTPFVKAGGALAASSAVELGRLAVRGLLEQVSLKPGQIDQLIAGNVATPFDAANIARVIALRAGIPQGTIAHTVSRNCASGLECVTQAIQLVESGQTESVIALGVESMSNIPLMYQQSYGKKLFQLGRAKSFFGKLKAAFRFRPADFKPIIGLETGLTDPYSGMIMGATAEKLAREYHISREDQDRFSLRSHQLAATAWNEGRLQSETMTIYPDPKHLPISHDIGPREDQSLAALNKLRPYFDRRWGTVTVGNSCQVTDGAAALLILSENKAKEWNVTPIGRVTGFAYAGCDPTRMGLGPVYATSKLLDQVNKKISDLDLIEINEAFATQVLACLKGFETPPQDCHCESQERLGPIDESKLNVNGGAIALGHPVGATGARMILTLLHELKRREQNQGLATLCVGGGQGGAVLVERMS